MSKKMLIINLLTALFFICICIIPFIAGMIFYFEHSKFLETAKLTEATIINIEERNHGPDEGTEILYFVEFSVDNTFYNGELNHYIEHENMLVGYTTPIYYNPENPNEFTGTAKPDYLFGFHIIFLPFLFPAYILLYTSLKPYSMLNQMI